jgi:hypothetical protein
MALKGHDFSRANPQAKSESGFSRRGTFFRSIGLPSGAKAPRYSGQCSGTTKVVPFQNTRERNSLVHAIALSEIRQVSADH